MPSPLLMLLLAATCCFTLATWLQPTLASLRGNGGEGSFLDAALGEFRVLISAQLFTKADVYLHAGFYPTIFDKTQMHQEKHIAQQPDGDDHDEAGHIEQGGQHEVAGDTRNAKPDYGFMGEPRDWLDRLGRNFYPSRHVHPGSPAEASEVLPWLRLSATLDPHRVETYSVGGYWLRQQVHRPDAAEAFLREGWRNNPESPEILLELGRACEANGRGDDRVRNIWKLALEKWEKQEARSPEPDHLLKMQILAGLIRLEERNGNSGQALAYRQVLSEVHAQRGSSASASESPSAPKPE